VGAHALHHSTLILCLTDPSPSQWSMVAYNYFLVGTVTGLNQTDDSADFHEVNTVPLSPPGAD
jgi:hypothetical protein